MIKRTNRFFILLFLFLLVHDKVVSQNLTARVFGVIKDHDKKPMPGVSIGVLGTTIGSVTNAEGEFTLTVPSNQEINIVFSSIGFETVSEKLILAEGERKEIKKTMIQAVTTLPTPVIRDQRDRGNVTRIDIKEVEQIPNLTGGIETVVKTFAGVASNNETSSEYSVRGGNFDENLVYVNDVEIYRPQLVRSGLQEGLSFVNPDMVSGLKFSAGGFDAQYGDKMSSVLDIRYRKPTGFAGKINYGLFGGNLTLEGITKNKKLSFLVGARQKSTKYLLGTLDTKGDYKPTFYDVQGIVNYDFNDKTSLSFLGNFSKSKYNIVPQNRTTDFGTVSQALRFTVYFDGQEVDDFSTRTGALSFSHSPNKNLNLKLIASAFNTKEEETFDILGQYYIGELEKDPAAENFGEVKLNLGVGSFLNHARNYLEGNVYSVEHKGMHTRKQAELLWGLKYQYEVFNDKINEWNYIDSSGFSLPHPQDSIGQPLQNKPQLILQDLLNRENSLNTNRISGYLQNNFFFSDNSRFTLTTGLRFNYSESVNNDTTAKNDFIEFAKRYCLSPRVALSYKPKWKRKFSFRGSGGFYFQPPFYKELQNTSGTVSTGLLAQQSIHAVVGGDYYFIAWGREFKFVTEAYYKWLYDMIPYKVDNVRIRYLGKNNSKGYAKGIDFRINGQFVNEAESWASLSLLKTEEDILDDVYYIRLNAARDTIRGYTIDKVATDSIQKVPGYLPRLTDQRATFSIFFSDYLPKFPSYRMHMTLVFGTGFPVGPPGDNRYTDVYRFPFYRRVDIGFSKHFIEEGKNVDHRIKFFNHFKSLALSLEVFNLLQVNNTVSYTWVSDVYGTKYGVPNYLTGRQLNVRLSAKF